jgi:hypothetical protein
MGVEREEIQTKCMDNLFSRIIAEIFLNLKKESHPGTGSLQKTKLSRQKKKEYPQTHHNQNSAHRTEKEF